MTVFMFITSISCKANDRKDHKVEVLNDDIYFKLSGAWHDYVKTGTDWYDFSWGRGKWVHGDSIIIDFGTNPPEFHAAGTTVFDILSVETLGEDKYKLNVQNQFGGKEKAYFIIHTDLDNAIWFEIIPEFDYIWGGKDHPYYNISGPKKTKS